MQDFLAEDPPSPPRLEEPQPQAEAAQEHVDEHVDEHGDEHAELAEHEACT